MRLYQSLYCVSSLLCTRCQSTKRIKSMPDKTWLFLHKGMEIERVRIRVFEEALVEREEEKR